MRKLHLNLTLPGSGLLPRTPAPPPPPDAPRRPPSLVDAAQLLARVGRPSGGATGVSGTVQNVGGARGLSLSNTIRALKSLTGQ